MPESDVSAGIAAERRRPRRHCVRRRLAGRYGSRDADFSRRSTVIAGILHFPEQEIRGYREMWRRKNETHHHIPPHLHIPLSEKNR
jgi:hypothetical protein